MDFSQIQDSNPRAHFLKALLCVSRRGLFFSNSWLKLFSSFWTVITWHRGSFTMCVYVCVCVVCACVRVRVMFVCRGFLFVFFFWFSFLFILFENSLDGDNLVFFEHNE